MYLTNNNCILVLSLEARAILFNRWRQHHKNQAMIFEILEIARKNPDGFTIELPSLEPVKTGIVVAYEATQNSFDIEGLKKCVRHALKHGNKIGGWLNTENGLFYFDSVITFKNEEEAIKFGKAQNQIAIFDLDNLRLIKL